jgi:GTP cyclohydrolase-4
VLPDVQLLKPEVPIRLNRVGVKGVKKLVEVEVVGKRRPIILISTFDVFIDLPSELKGANLSRNLEAIDTVIEKVTSKPVRSIEELCIELVDELLKKHEYAEIAEVSMKAELIMRKKTPVTKQRTEEVVNITCEVVKHREGLKKVFVGVEVCGVTACPCGQELVKAKVKEVLRGFLSEYDVEKVLNEIPMPTHNQRGRAIIKIEVRDNFSPRIEDLVKIAKESMSYETFELLKREDELEVIWQMHKNPRFVEDCVRVMAKKIAEFFRNAPDDVLVYIRQENEESIHQHNVVAELFTTIGELKMGIDNSS